MRYLFITVLLLFFPVLACSDDYVIGDGDGLQIAVWDTPQLSTGATVRPDGKITLPGVGDVVASGLTPVQLSERLTVKLKDFVKKPIVTVTVQGITNNKVYVFGGGASGVFNMPDRTTLLKFLTKFGALKNADLQGAYLVRNGKKVEVDFYTLYIKGDLSKDIPLHAEDILYIPDNELNKIYVMGAVTSPRSVLYREGLRILDVILECGGFTKFAKENSVLVMRKDGNQVKEIEVRVKDVMKDGELSKNIGLLPGDFVVVKESIF